MAPTTVAIIGASYAGLHIAHSLLTVPDVKVVLVNPSTVFYWNIAAPRIVAKAKADAESLIERRGRMAEDKIAAEEAYDAALSNLRMVR